MQKTSMFHRTEEKTLTDSPRPTPILCKLHGLFRCVVQIAIVAALSVAPAQAAKLRILAFGDSLTAGLGVTANEALPAQLQRRLAAKGYDIEIINAGVSGDTTETALGRLDYALDGGPFDVAIVELGANDMLRGLDPKTTRANLAAIISRIKARGAKVLLAAMVSEANWGQAYKNDFDSIYPDLAAKHEAPLIPFFMAGIWDDPSMLVGDGLHPNPKGVGKMVDLFAPVVEKALDSLGQRKTSTQ